MATTSTLPTSQPQANNFQATDIEERDGFVEYCKLRTCERLAVDHVDALEEAEEADIDKMRVIAIESKIEWRGFTDNMKQFWIKRASVKATLDSWKTFMSENNVNVPTVYATGPPATGSATHTHSH
ncbi:hypothetical protein EMPS_03025 [Entomortierella parvispora]|uniref:Uncharacterized protein n=1 Tax=Entomortierella parvispora TaxID=205924 RepID=A0A9P3LUH7_9FUNG|nr:hypothetical protein EMPS_03025 [Entomortierella parvispora]